MNDLIHIIYNSVATSHDVEDDLRDILAVSRRKNPAAQITGMLLYADGSFFQVLEGPEHAVDAAADMIARDPRHARMSVIIREPIARRAFGEWTMGFAVLTTDELREMDGVNDLFQAGTSFDAIDSGRAKKLLRAFEQGRWRVRLTPHMPPVGALRMHQGSAALSSGTSR